MRTLPGYLSDTRCPLTGTTMDMRLHFTSSYYLEANGQAERTNQILEQYLRVYCNYQQDNWSELLPLVEFAYNNASSATTGVSLFFTNKRYHPNLSVYPEFCHDLAKWLSQYLYFFSFSFRLLLRWSMGNIT